MKRSYIQKITGLIRRGWYAVLFLILIVVGTIELYQILPSTFVPEEDQGYFIAALNLPEGTSMNVTEKSMHNLAESIRKMPGVSGVMEISGFDLLSDSSKSNSGTFFISLEDWAERSDPSCSADSLIERINDEAENIVPEASVMVMNPPSLPGLGMIGGFNLQLQDVTGHTEEELAEVSERIIEAANQRPELEEVSTSYNIESPYVDFELNRDKVMELGLELSDVFEAMQVNFGGAEVNDFTQFGHNYKVMLQADTWYRSETENAKFIFVRNTYGEMVPLSTLLNVQAQPQLPDSMECGAWIFKDTLRRDIHQAKL